MSYDEFGDTSPAELELLLEHNRQLTDLDNYRVGLVAAAIYNQKRTKKSDKFFNPSDFFSSLNTQTPAPTKRASDEEIAASQAAVIQAMCVMDKTYRKRKNGKRN